MKKKILVMLTLILCAVIIYPVTAEETVENETTNEVTPETRSGVDITSDFTDPIFRQFVTDKYGTDGVVLDTDVASVLTIEMINYTFENSVVQDLSGIEHFAALKELSIIGANLGDISVTDFANTLEILFLYNSKVTSLNTSGGGENITHLTISKNPIGSIDLSPLQSLNQFFAEDMPPALTELDLCVAPELERFRINNSYVERLDLSACQTINVIQITGSEVSELILPDTYLVGVFDKPSVLSISGTRLEHLVNAPYEAFSIWESDNLRPLKEIKINENGNPYIEVHDDSYIVNLDELNANGEDFIWDREASPVTVTWVASTDPQAFYDQYNKEILFSNQRPAARGAYQPLEGYYELIPTSVEPQGVYHTVNFLDCDGNLVGQAWPEDGGNATPPAGYNYDASLITNVTSSRDVSPLDCPTGFTIPNTGR